jgi:hypothetical protein
MADSEDWDDESFLEQFRSDAERLQNLQGAGMNHDGAGCICARRQLIEDKRRRAEPSQLGAESQPGGAGPHDHDILACCFH